MLPTLAIPLTGVAVPTYSLCAALAAILGAALAWPRLQKRGLNRIQSAGLLLCMAACFLIGARLWNVAVNPANYSGSLRWYSPQLTGLSLFGGISGASLVLLPTLRYRRIPVPAVLDDFVIPACAAFMLARLGCLAAGCCSGRVTAATWGMIFPSRTRAQEALGQMLPLLGGAKPLHPTQLYELIGAAVCLIIIVFARKRLRNQGDRFLLFGGLFCLMRLAVLPFRALAYRPLVADIVYPALYCVLAVLGFGILLLRHKSVLLRGWRPCRKFKGE